MDIEILLLAIAISLLLIFWKLSYLAGRTSRNSDQLGANMDLKIATDAVLQTLMRYEPPEMRGQQHLKVRKGRIVPQSALAYLSNVNDTLKMGSVGVRDRWIVYVKETSPGVFRLFMRDTEQHRSRELTAEARSDDDLITVIEGWREKIQWWRNRLSFEN